MIITAIKKSVFMKVQQFLLEGKLRQSNMYINQQDAQNSVIKLYFPLDALNVSDCVSPSSGTAFRKLYIVFGIFGCLAVVWL